MYHTIENALPVLIAKKIRGFNLILEVEEIYQDVCKYSKFDPKLEYKIFNEADSYIYSTKILNGKVNHDNKQYVVINGKYQIEEDKKLGFQDGKIHCLYSGTFDYAKQGAYIAARAALYLPANYQMHISGFGTNDQQKKIQTLIAECQKQTECVIVYEGLLSTDRYMELLQKCQIGLNTQTPNERLSNSCFPSKILLYLCNGLRVVSSSCEAIRESEVNDLLFYYKEQNPKDIAETILAIDLSQKYDSRKRVQQLDCKAVEDIKRLIN